MRTMYLAELRRQDYLAEAERERRIDAAITSHNAQCSNVGTPASVRAVSRFARWARGTSLLRRSPGLHGRAVQPQVPSIPA